MTKYEIERTKHINLMESTNYRGSGCRGCVNELEHRLSRSAAIGVATQGKADCSIRYQKSTWAKAKAVPAENKTGGGRIDSLYAVSAPQFVIYEYFYTYKNKKGVCTEYHIDAKVIPTELFLAKLDEFGAIKAVNRNGRRDGTAIQVSNKAFRLWLEEYPIDWEKDYTFEEWMFEGLD